MGIRHSKEWICHRIHANTRVQGSDRNTTRDTKASSGDSRGNPVLVKQKCHRKGASGGCRPRFLLQDILSKKEARRTKTNSKFKANKLLHKKAEVQNGDPKVCKKSSKEGGSLMYSGSQGRLHAYKDTRGSQEVSKIQGQRSSIPVEGCTFWPLFSSSSVHKSPSASHRRGSQARGLQLPILGRCFSSRHVNKPISNQCKYFDSFVARKWLGDQHSKVIHKPLSGQSVCRRPVCNQSELSNATDRQRAEHKGLYRSVHNSEGGSSQSFSETTRHDGSVYRGSALSQTAYETYTVIPHVLLETELPRSTVSSTNQSGSNQAPSVVAERSEPLQRLSTGGGRARDNYSDRLQLPRMGSPYRESICTGTVAGTTAEVAYQFAGNENCHKSMSTFSPITTGQDSISEVGQYDCGLVHQQTRRDKVQLPMHGSMGVVEMGGVQPNTPEVSTFEGGDELCSRQTVKRSNRPHRVVSKQSSSLSDIPETGGANDRPICHSGEPSSTAVLLQEDGGGGLSYRCSESRLDSSRRIRLSTIPTDSLGSRQDRETSVCCNSDSAILAKEVMATENARSTSRHTHPVTRKTRSTLPVGRRRLASGPRKALSGGMAIERQQLLQEGFPEPVVKTMLHSDKPNTSEVYNRQWQGYEDWCNSRNYSPCRATVSQVCEYLQLHLDNGLAYRTIAVIRSAISKYHEGIDGLPVGQHKRVRKFMKGVFNRNPPVRTLTPSWELEVVLNALQKAPFEPMKSASLKHCTLKTVFLVAISSARRCSEIMALGRNEPYLRFEAGGVRIRPVPDFLPKTAVPWHLGQDIVLPDLDRSHKKLNVRRSIKYYLKKSNKVLQDNQSHLFVAFGGIKKGQSVTNQTIARWLVSTVHLAYTLEGMELPKLTAHSTRGLATSTALFKGASILDIMKAADWRSMNTFARHYGLNLWKKRDSKFGRSVLT